MAKIIGLQDIVSSKSYTPKMATLTRFYTLLAVLKATFKSYRRDRAVNETVRLLKGAGRVNDTQIHREFTKAQLRYGWLKSKSVMVRCYAKENTTEAGPLDLTCNICMVNKGDYVCVHASTAHGGVCGSCAMQVVIGKNPRCPMCNQTLDLICHIKLCKVKVFDC